MDPFQCCFESLLPLSGQFLGLNKVYKLFWALLMYCNIYKFPSFTSLLQKNYSGSVVGWYGGRVVGVRNKWKYIHLSSHWAELGQSLTWWGTQEAYSEKLTLKKLMIDSWNLFWKIERNRWENHKTCFDRQPYIAYAYMWLVIAWKRKTMIFCKMKRVWFSALP